MTRIIRSRPHTFMCQTHGGAGDEDAPRKPSPFTEDALVAENRRLRAEVRRKNRMLRAARESLRHATELLSDSEHPDYYGTEIRAIDAELAPRRRRP